MNDLAEKALDGALALGRHLARRPMPPLALLGFAAASLAVFAGGRIGASADALPPTRWLDLLSPAGYQLTDDIPASLLVGGITILLAAWLVALRLGRGGRLSERQAWTLTAAWSLPFVLGPPLLSTDVYGYVAHGLLTRAGLDPYRYAPDVLRHSTIADSIDPGTRGMTSTGGPLSTLTEHLSVAIAGGSALTAVLLLRALAVVCTVAIGILAAELSGPRRVSAICLTSLNPAVLLYLVSGCHLDGLMAALVLGALVAAGQRRWALAVVLVCLAAGVKPYAVLALPALLAAHAIGQRGRVSWRILGRDAALAALTLVASVFSVNDGMGWARNLSSSTHEHTLYAPANLVSDLIALVVSSASYDDLAVGGRVAAVMAAATAVSYLLVTVLQRPLERTVGYALLWMGLLGPVLYPWYLLWGLVCLAPGATRTRRDWVIALSCVATFLSPVGFTTRTGEVVTAGAIAVVAAVLGQRGLARHRASTASGDRGGDRLSDRR